MKLYCASPKPGKGGGKLTKFTLFGQFVAPINVWLQRYIIAIQNILPVCLIMLSLNRIVFLECAGICVGVIIRLITNCEQIMCPVPETVLSYATSQFCHQHDEQLFVPYSLSNLFLPLIILSCYSFYGPLLPEIKSMMMMIVAGLYVEAPIVLYYVCVCSKKEGVLTLVPYLNQPWALPSTLQWRGNDRKEWCKFLSHVWSLSGLECDQVRLTVGLLVPNQQYRE